MITEAFNLLRVFRNDVINGMPWDEFTFLIDPKLWPLRDVLA